MNQSTSTVLYALRADVFRDKLGQIFYVEGPNGAIAIRLVKVWEGKEPLFRGSERRPFTLSFLGPPAPPKAGHVQVNLRHHKLGLIEGIFLGPVIGAAPPEWGEGQLWTADFT